jgi:hypothetical protein
LNGPCAVPVVVVPFTLKSVIVSEPVLLGMYCGVRRKVDVVVFFGIVIVNETDSVATEPPPPVVVPPPPVVAPPPPEVIADGSEAPPPPPPHAASAATIKSAMKFRSVLRKSPLHYGSREKLSFPLCSFSAATTDD